MKDPDKDKLIEILKVSEERYRSVTQTSVDAILTSDASDTILTWNKGAELIFGHGQEILGDPIETIIPEKFREVHREGLRRFIKTGEKHLIGRTAELEALRKDGTICPIELSLSTWSSESGIYFGGVIRDISERKHIERIREDVYRMMRHDLKSPLIGITGLAKVVQKGGNLTEKQRKAAALIQDLGEKTLNFIARSRDLFQMERGDYSLKPRPVELIALLNRVRQELEPLALKTGIEFEVSLSGHHPQTGSEYIVSGEEGLLETMFANLIKNAVEASPEGSAVKISIRSGEEKGQSSHIIDIHNSGIVPQDIRDRFFDPYSTSGKERGTGLGTHSARLVARAHQGDIRFTTSEKEGTHVVVMLPKEITS